MMPQLLGMVVPVVENSGEGFNIKFWPTMCFMFLYTLKHDLGYGVSILGVQNQDEISLKKTRFEEKFETF